MKLGTFYDCALKFGKQFDPRKDKQSIGRYPDTAILFGDPAIRVKKILVGIDIEVAELLLADRLRTQQGLDLVVSHHPEGKALASLYEVMALQVDVLVSLGLKRRVAEEYLCERIREIERRVLPTNHTRAVDAARLLHMPFMCVHTPADNHVAYFLHSLFARKKPANLKEVAVILGELDEYKDAITKNAGPKIIAGSPSRPAGKIFVDMTGGTEGSKDVFESLHAKGVRTIVAMHLSEEHFKKVKDAHLNVIIAGHISSDTLGLNLLLDNIERVSGEQFAVVCCSGFRRVRRG
jgi:putative NIF3 family GTP cyclohydrolase 1 type 2